jgi:hypothetical protein
MGQSSIAGVSSPTLYREARDKGMTFAPAELAVILG